MKKTVLIMLDGLRSDALEIADPPFFQELKKICSYTLDARSIVPSITLPVITSIFLGTKLETHEVFDNIFTVKEAGRYGLFELLREKNLKSSIYYNWEEIGRIAKVGTVSKGVYSSGELIGWKESKDEILSAAMRQYDNDIYDFTVQYFVNIDMAGHLYGWMSQQYLDEVIIAFEDVEKIFNKLGDKYEILVCTDHGGHDKTHGLDIEEDMRIPLFIYASDNEPGLMGGEVSAIDITPTIATLMGLEIPKHWEGRPLV